MNRDWRWKLGEAINRLQERYEYIGSKSGAPFLAIVYPPEAELAVYNEWETQIAHLSSDYEVQIVDLLVMTVDIVSELGSEHVVDSIENPMPGSKPEAELGAMWIANITREIRECLDHSQAEKPVAVLYHVAALHPATSPRYLLQGLWDDARALRGPVIIFIPGTLNEARVYTFLNRKREAMYRGDII